MKKLFSAVSAGIILIALCRIETTSAISIVLKVGVNINLPPYQYVTESGQITGLHVDIMDKLAEINDFVIEYIPFDNTFDAMNALMDDQIDAVIGVPEKKYSAWEAEYSDEINTAILCLVADETTAKVYEETRGNGDKMTIALEGDTIDYNHMSSMISSSIILKDTQISAFNMMHHGFSDMFIGVKDTAIFLMRHESIGEEYTIIENYISNISYEIAIRKNDPYLLSLLNRGIAQLHITGEYGELIDMWSMADNSSILVARLKRVLMLCLIIIIAGGIYSFLSRRVKKILEKEVNIRTNALNETNQLILRMNSELEQRFQKEKEYSQILNAIIETAQSAMFLMNNEGMVLHSNQHAIEMEDVFQQGYIFRGEWVKIELRSLLKLFIQEESGSKQISGTISVKSSVGHQKTIRYHIYHMVENKPSRHLIVMDDITAETIEQQAQLEKQKNEALNRMVASIAHEIKNPLTTISAAINMVYDKRSDERFMGRFREIVPQEVERINRLVQNLVSYARPSKSLSEKIDISSFLAVFEQIVAPLTSKTQVKLSIESMSGLSVMASRDRLNQILLNFIMNSLESISNKCDDPPENYYTSIRIIATKLEKFVSISVWDNGVGMGEKEVENCFKPFYSNKPAGTGLGLTISAQYIHEIGGTIYADGKLGEYACLTVFLPAVGE